MRCFMVNPADGSMLFPLVLMSVRSKVLGGVDSSITPSAREELILMLHKVVVTRDSLEFLLVSRMALLLVLIALFIRRRPLIVMICILDMYPTGTSCSCTYRFLPVCVIVILTSAFTLLFSLRFPNPIEAHKATSQLAGRVRLVTKDFPRAALTKVAESRSIYERVVARLMLSVRLQAVTGAGHA